MLGHLSGLLAVSFLIVRDSRYIVLMSVVFTMIAVFLSFNPQLGVPFL